MECFIFNVDEIVHWCVLNLSNAVYGMYLYGFYFYVDVVGDGNCVEFYKDIDFFLLVM